MARRFVHKLGLQNQDEWFKWCRSKGRPADIPVSADKVYKNKGWNSYGDWLGTNRIANKDKNYLPYQEARKFARNLKLQGKNKWIKYSKLGKLPSNIPRDPYGQYINKGWIGWGDWLGTGNIRFKKFRSFGDARKFVRLLELKNTREWEEYSKSGDKPSDIPSNPGKVYRTQGWKSINDWLGTDIKPFDKAKSFARSLGLKSKKEWLRTKIC